MNNKTTEKIWDVLRWVLVLTEVIMLVLLVCWGISIYNEFFEARADGIQEEVWVLCEPEGCVNLREKPKGQIFGGVQACSVLWTDNVTKGSWLHVVELPAECDSGWISSRYIVYDRPEEIKREMRIQAEGRVACREWIGGKVIRWVYDGDVITVYYMSDEWSVTDHGYIKTEFITEAEEYGSEAA